MVGVGRRDSGRSDLASAYRRRSREIRGQAGFTLIELLVVVGILSALAGVVVYAARDMVNNGDVSACRLERRTIITAMGVADATDNPSDTYLDNLENPMAPRYFERTGGTDLAPVWGPVADRHPGGDCPTTIP